MILRKPYAFLIKHFKLIHLILTALFTYLIYRTNLILTFFNQYIGSQVNVIGQDISGILFSGFMILVIVLALLFSGILLAIMAMKKKPYTFYIAIMIMSIYMMIIFLYVSSVALHMETALIDVRVVRIARDLVTSVFFAECISVIITLIRGTGFDIKKFNFVKDLQELDIEENDNEEFELAVEVDSNRIRRVLRKKIRYAKYAYREHRFLFNIGILFGIGIICTVLYWRSGFYDKLNEQGTNFQANNFTMGITQSYITNLDYRGNNISGDDYLVVLEMNLKRNGKSDLSFDTATSALLIGDFHYCPVSQYRSSVFDFGHVYQGENVSNKFQKYTLVYQIPKQLINEKMIFNFIDKTTYNYSRNPKSVKIRLQPLQIDNNSSLKQYQLNESVDLSGSILRKSKLEITSFELADQFRLDYQFCAVADYCYASYEYMRADPIANEKRSLLKLTGTLSLDSSIQLDDMYDLSYFVKAFGTLKYEINGVSKTQTVNWKQVKPVYAKKENTYYLEVLPEVVQADRLTLTIHLRNRNYEIILK